MKKKLTETALSTIWEYLKILGLTGTFDAAFAQDNKRFNQNAYGEKAKFIKDQITFFLNKIPEDIIKKKSDIFLELSDYIAQYALPSHTFNDKPLVALKIENLRKMLDLKPSLNVIFLSIADKILAPIETFGQELIDKESLAGRFIAIRENEDVGTLDFASGRLANLSDKDPSESITLIEKALQDETKYNIALKIFTALTKLLEIPPKSPLIPIKEKIVAEISSQVAVISRYEDIRNSAELERLNAIAKQLLNIQSKPSIAAIVKSCPNLHSERACDCARLISQRIKAFETYPILQELSKYYPDANPKTIVEALTKVVFDSIDKQSFSSTSPLDDTAVKVLAFVQSTDMEKVEPSMISKASSIDDACSMVWEKLTNIADKTDGIREDCKNIDNIVSELKKIYDVTTIQLDFGVDARRDKDLPLLEKHTPDYILAVTVILDEIEGIKSKFGGVISSVAQLQERWTSIKIEMQQVKRELEQIDTIVMKFPQFTANDTNLLTLKRSYPKDQIDTKSLVKLKEIKEQYIQAANSFLDSAKVEQVQPAPQSQQKLGESATQPSKDIVINTVSQNASSINILEQRWSLATDAIAQIREKVTEAEENVKTAMSTILGKTVTKLEDYVEAINGILPKEVEQNFKRSTLHRIEFSNEGTQMRLDSNLKLAILKRDIGSSTLPMIFNVTTQEADASLKALLAKVAIIKQKAAALIEIRKTKAGITKNLSIITDTLDKIAAFFPPESVPNLNQYTEQQRQFIDFTTQDESKIKTEEAKNICDEKKVAIEKLLDSLRALYVKIYNVVLQKNALSDALRHIQCQYDLLSNTAREFDALPAVAIVDQLDLALCKEDSAVSLWLKKALVVEKQSLSLESDVEQYNAFIEQSKTIQAQMAQGKVQMVANVQARNGFCKKQLAILEDSRTQAVTKIAESYESVLPQTGKIDEEYGEKAEKETTKNSRKIFISGAIDYEYKQKLVSALIQQCASASVNIQSIFVEKQKYQQEFLQRVAQELLGKLDISMWRTTSQERANSPIIKFINFIETEAKQFNVELTGLLYAILQKELHNTIFKQVGDYQELDNRLKMKIQELLDNPKQQGEQKPQAENRSPVKASYAKEHTEAFSELQKSVVEKKAEIRDRLKTNLLGLIEKISQTDYATIGLLADTVTPFKKWTDPLKIIIREVITDKVLRSNLIATINAEEIAFESASSAIERLLEQKRDKEAQLEKDSKALAEIACKIDKYEEFLLTAENKVGKIVPTTPKKKIELIDQLPISSSQKPSLQPCIQFTPQEAIDNLNRWNGFLCEAIVEYNKAVALDVIHGVTIAGKLGYIKDTYKGLIKRFSNHSEALLLLRKAFPAATNVSLARQYPKDPVIARAEELVRIITDSNINKNLDTSSETDESDKVFRQLPKIEVPPAVLNPAPQPASGSHDKQEENCSIV